MNSLTPPTEPTTGSTDTSHAQGFPQSRKTSQIVPSTGAEETPADAEVPRETSSTEPSEAAAAAAAPAVAEDVSAGQEVIAADETVASEVPAQAAHQSEPAVTPPVTE